MKANACMQVLAKHRGDAVVVCALGMAANEWWAVTRSEAEPDYQRAPPASYEGPEMKYRFGRAMEKKLGIKVFGPRGF